MTHHREEIDGKFYYTPSTQPYMLARFKYTQALAAIDTPLAFRLALEVRCRGEQGPARLFFVSIFRARPGQPPLPHVSRNPIQSIQPPPREQLSLETLWLCRGDNMGARYYVPAFFLRLGTPEMEQVMKRSGTLLQRASRSLSI